MANEVVGIDVVAHLDQLRQEFKSIPKVANDETKALTAAVNKNIKALEKEIARAGRTSRATRVEVDSLTRSSKDFGDSAGRTGQNASKLAGAVGLISPAAAEAVRTIADLADVGEVAADVQGALGMSSVRLTAVLGPVAIAVGVLAAAYFYLQSKAEEANKRVEASAAAATLAQDAHERLSKMRLSAADAEAIATGRATAGDIALRESIASVTAEYEPRIAALRTAIAEQDALDASNAAIIASGKGVGAQIQVASDAQRAAAAEAARLRGELGGLTQQQGALIQQTVRGNILGRADVEIKGAQAAATEDLTEGFAEQEAELRASLDRRMGDRELEAAFIQISSESEMGAIMARIEAEQKAAEEIDRIREEAALKEADRLARLAEERRAQEKDELAATSDLWGSISSVAQTARENMNAEDKRGAAAAFAVEKAAGIAQVAVNAIIGVSEAAASAPPPLNIPAIVAATGQGIASGVAVASVPAPSFNDTPGVQQMGTRGNVSLGAGDFFAAARDPEELRRQVNGGADPHADYRTGGPQVSVIGARAFGRRIRDDVRTTTPLARIIFAQSGRQVGGAGRR